MSSTGSSTPSPSSSNHSMSTSFHTSAFGERSERSRSPNSTINVKIPPSSVGLLGSKDSMRRKALLTLVDRLIHLGVNKDMELPQIAAIGDQSVGKSSVVELITGIKLPRSSGTCTRCATECLVKNSDGPWHCDVYIYYTGDEDTRQIHFGPTIYNPEDVTDRVRRAQRAILNPSVDNPLAYLDDNKAVSVDNEVSFSRDYISIQISGPDLVDLSFVDLPGIIHSVGSDQNPRDIELVRDLTVRYIEKKSCLILLTVSCVTDMENQAASRLAQEYDPAGERTIGVLTKPDLIQEGDEEIWIKRVRNEDKTRHLKLGWYCVKLLNPTQLKENMQREQAFQEEVKFFTASRSPWSILSMRFHNLGVQKLVSSLSSTLSDIIAKRIPELQEELQTMYIRTQEELRSMSKPPAEDATAEMMALISDFAQDVRQLVDGLPGKNGLHQQLRHAQKSFRDRIRSTAPDFRPYLNEADDDQVEMDFLGSEETQKVDCGQIVYIKEVKEMIDDACARELPGTIPFVVTKELIDVTRTQWEQHTLSYFDEAYGILSALVKSLSTKHFSKYEVGNLESKVSSILQETLEKVASTTRDHLLYELNKEAYVYTANTKYLMDYKVKFESRYRARWLAHRSGSELAIEALRHLSEQTSTRPFQTVMQTLASLGLVIEDPMDLTRLLPKDDYEDCLGIMAMARAYFHVSSKRFSDNVPLSVDYDLVRGIGRDVHRALYDALMSGDVRDRCQLYIQEHPSTSALRSELTAKLERLKKAKQEMLTV